MGKNVGAADKTVRIIIAVLIAAAGYYYNNWWLYLIALLLLITALFGFCPIYKMFGINTCKLKKVEVKIEEPKKEEVKKKE